MPGGVMSEDLPDATVASLRAAIQSGWIEAFAVEQYDPVSHRICAVMHTFSEAAARDRVMREGGRVLAMRIQLDGVFDQPTSSTRSANSL